jgi:hypothetical protein
VAVVRDQVAYSHQLTIASGAGKIAPRGRIHMLIRRLVFVALFLWPAAAAWCACVHSGTGNDYCGPELITLLDVDSSGAVYVRPSSALSPLPAGFVCTPVSGTYFVLSPSNANFKQIYAALLSARIAGAPVTIVSDPSQSACTILYITL